MKIYISFLLVILLFLSASFRHLTSELRDQVVGKWKWVTIINSSTNEEAGLELVTMGLASDVKVEFKEDNTYVESKRRKAGAEYSTLSGEWKIEKDAILSTKQKDKWISMRILKLSNDSLLLEMNKDMNLLMIKEK